MGPNGGGAPTGELAAAIDAAFGSFDDFKAKLKDAGVKRFGSGWAWLVLGRHALAVTSHRRTRTTRSWTARRRSSASTSGSTRTTCKYQNRRPDYLDAWWNTVNWSKVAERYAARG